MERALLALSGLCREMDRKGIETGRIAKVAFHLLEAGLGASSLPVGLVDKVIAEQRADGGWIGSNDSAYAVALLNRLGKDGEAAQGLHWIAATQLPTGGWGRSPRDIPRIPATGLLLWLLPELGNEGALDWLVSAWVREFGSITYKGAYTLLGRKRGLDPALRDRTLAWLATQQDEDGGLGPWKGHPVGSNVLCTALAALAALDHLPRGEIFLSSAIGWLVRNQLPGGLWPYHQIEDGGAWGLTALASFLRHEG